MTYLRWRMLTLALLSRACLSHADTLTLPPMRSTLCFLALAAAAAVCVSAQAPNPPPIWPVSFQARFGLSMTPLLSKPIVNSTSLFLYNLDPGQQHTAERYKRRSTWDDSRVAIPEAMREGKQRTLSVLLFRRQLMLSMPVCASLAPAVNGQLIDYPDYCPASPKLLVGGLESGCQLLFLESGIYVSQPSENIKV